MVSAGDQPSWYDDTTESTVEVLPIDESNQDNPAMLKLEEVPEDAVLNLDVSTMIAYASALTNGRHNFRFRENVLTEQAESERLRPVRPMLDALLSPPRKLVCCRSAHDDFAAIIRVMAGPCEAEAAQRLLERVVVVPDQPSARAASLSLRGKIRRRSKAIFGTGDQIKAVTVTANNGFLRAAHAQGVDFVAIVHDSRALTEAKEVTATPL